MITAKAVDIVSQSQEARILQETYSIDVQEIHHEKKPVHHKAIRLSDAFPVHHEQPHCYSFITLAVEMLYITEKLMYNFLRANHM